MKNLGRKLSVIMPAYNEESCIFETVQETIRTLQESLNLDYEIIVVDDGSNDGTYQVLRKIAQMSDKIKVVKLNSHQGKGLALKQGFKSVRGDLVGFLDADLDLHPRQLGSFLKIMERTKSDVVIGSKRHPESRSNYPKRRRILSFFYHLMVCLLFRLPITDTQVGLKLFKYEVLEKVFPKLLVKAYAFDLELLANTRRLGYKIVEAPISLNFDRETHWGRIGLRGIRSMLTDTLAIFYRMYILKYYDKH